MSVVRQGNMSFILIKF